MPAQQISNWYSKKPSCFYNFILIYELNCDRDLTLDLLPLSDVLFPGLL